MKSRLSLAAALGLALVAAVWFTTRRGVPNAPVVAPSAASMAPLAAETAAPRRVRYPVGKELVFALRHHAEQRVAIPGTEWLGAAGADLDALGHARIDVEADLVLRALGDRNGYSWLGARLEKPTKVGLLFGGVEKVSGDEAMRGLFEANEAYAALTGDGALAAVAFRKEAPGTFQRVLQHLLQQLTVVLGDGSVWQSREATPLGLSDTVYHRGGALDAPRLRKQRLRLVDWLQDEEHEPRPTLVSSFDVELGEGGTLRKLTGSDRLQAPASPLGSVASASSTPRAELATTETDCRFRELRNARAGALPPDGELIVRSASQGYASPEERQRLLSDRAQGLTFEQLWDTISDMGAMAGFPGSERFVLRASSYLALHPGDAAKLAPLFVDPAAGSLRRGLVLDLLVSADTPEAQRELRRLLDSAEARRDPAANTLAQRLSFLRHPDAETQRLVLSRFAGENGPARIAAAYSVAAVAHHLAANGQVTEARALGERLCAEADRAAEGRERAELLRSMNGLRMPELVGPIGRNAASTSVEVRAATAFALRRVQTRESEAIVRRLLRDREASVQSEALRTLSAYRLERDALKDVVDRATQGAVATELFGEVAEILASSQDDQGEFVRGAAQQLLAVDGVDRTTRMRLQAMAAGLR